VRQTSVSKHLRVLREAGFVESPVEAQQRVYRIRPEPDVAGLIGLLDRMVDNGSTVIVIEHNLDVVARGLGAGHGTGRGKRRRGDRL